MTTVGLWFVLLTLLVAVAATNTGNNALYMVLALMLAVLVVSGLVSRQNVRGLEVRLADPGEVYVNRPFTLDLTLRSRGRILPRWFVLVDLGKGSKPLLIPHLPPGSKSASPIEVMLGRRGPHRFQAAHVASLFPFGFFRKGERYKLGLEVLVFPELFAAATVRPTETPHIGDDPSRRAGWGHDLHELRAFRPGDDPRGIHWKQTARTGRMIYTERMAEHSRRLAILFDNGVGPLAGAEQEKRFERLVSEAATAAVDHLARGFEVELVTREGVTGFAAGLRQRLSVLEILARVEPVAVAATPLQSSDAQVPELRLRLEAPTVPRAAGGDPPQGERRAG
jgi:uncharacterized protein (DUF58 family)